MLLDNGIVLIDGLGPDIMTLHEGSQIRIEEDGQVFSKSGKLIAQGTLQTKESVAQLIDQARQPIAPVGSLRRQHHGLYEAGTRPAAKRRGYA